MPKPKPAPQYLPTGNLQLPDGTWVDVNKINDPDYREALSIGVAKLIETSKLSFNELQCKAPLGRRRKLHE